jgi:hypothetical protein
MHITPVTDAPNRAWQSSVRVGAATPVDQNLTFRKVLQRSTFGLSLRMNKTAAPRSLSSKGESVRAIFIASYRIKYFLRYKIYYAIAQSCYGGGGKLCRIRNKRKFCLLRYSLQIWSSTVFARRGLARPRRGPLVKAGGHGRRADVPTSRNVRRYPRTTGRFRRSRASLSLAVACVIYLTSSGRAGDIHKGTCSSQVLASPECGAFFIGRAEAGNAGGAA